MSKPRTSIAPGEHCWYDLPAGTILRCGDALYFYIGVTVDRKDRVVTASFLILEESLSSVCAVGVRVDRRLLRHMFQEDAQKGVTSWSGFEILAFPSDFVPSILGAQCHLS